MDRDPLLRPHLSSPPDLRGLLMAAAAAVLLVAPVLLCPLLQLRLLPMIEYRKRQKALLERRLLHHLTFRRLVHMPRLYR